MAKLEARQLIDQSIKVYNDLRPYMGCKMMTPNQAHIKGKNKYKKWRNYSMTEEWNYPHLITNKSVNLF